ncbi:MAG: hypothetical protein ACK5LS_00310 [Propioniciclava sp.]
MWDDADPVLARERVDGFLHYPFSGYVEPNDDAAEVLHVSLLSNLISALRADGCRVVASCGFEDQIARLTGWNWSEQTHPSVTFAHEEHGPAA